MKTKLDYIIEKIKHIQKIQILELGVRKGDSTRKFIELCNANDGFLTSVDIDDCSKVVKSERWKFIHSSDDNFEIIDKNIPIEINGVELTANVIDVTPFLMGYRVLFSLGKFPIKEYIYFLKEFYDEFQKYEIEIVDGLDFKVKKYFDIPINNWKLDKLVPSVLEAHKKCKSINDLES